MTKTPEQMAEEYAATKTNNIFYREPLSEAFLAGYQAAKDTYKDAISTYEEVAKQMLEEAVRIMSPKDRLADVSKVMNSSNNSNGWISVKKRLPVFRQYNQNDDSGYTEYVLMCFAWGRIRISNFEKVDGIVTTGYGNNLNEVTHWMPLPKPPEEK